MTSTLGALVQSIGDTNKKVDSLCSNLADFKTEIKSDYGIMKERTATNKSSIEKVGDKLDKQRSKTSDLDRDKADWPGITAVEKKVTALDLKMDQKFKDADNKMEKKFEGLRGTILKSLVLAVSIVTLVLVGLTLFLKYAPGPIKGQ